MVSSLWFQNCHAKRDPFCEIQREIKLPHDPRPVSAIPRLLSLDAGLAGSWVVYSFHILASNVLGPTTKEILVTNYMNLL